MTFYLLNEVKLNLSDQCLYDDILIEKVLRNKIVQCKLFHLTMF